MRGYFVELSKYIMVLTLALYTLESFLVFSLKGERARKNLYRIQTAQIFIVQFLAYMTLYLRTQNQSYLFSYAFSQLFLAAALSLTLILFERTDRLLVNNMCMFLGISFLILSRLDQSKAFRQLGMVTLSVLLGWLVLWLVGRAKALQKMTWVYAAFGVVSLGAVLMLGNMTRGSKISFSFYGITFQPSEFVKLAFVFFLAAILYDSVSFLRTVLATLIAAVHVMILVLSRDLGSALIFFVAFVAVVFMATGNYLYLALGSLSGCGAAYAAYRIFSHVRVRVLAWQDPFSYIDGLGYQITQSLFAVGSGGWFGLGMGAGNPGDIPLVESDFIFSAVCEEMGVISGICVMLIAVSCFVRMLQIGLNSADRFYRLLAYGFGVIYIFQIFLTVGGGIKFIPMTGVTFPLISYGGSSILTTVLLFFIVQALYLKQQEGGRKREAKKAEG